MSYLLAISIGPVQDFIAAARRTADLFAGSELLTEITKNIAEILETHIKAHGGQLIFPNASKEGGANKILAEVSSDPTELVKTIKTKARDFLLGEWETAYTGFSHKNVVQEARAKAQIQEFLEIYAAWVELGDYKESRRQVERLLAGRKALRDFQQAAQDDSTIPKSPLDASRACVLKLIRDENRVYSVPVELVNDKKLRFNKTEFLDAISLLKRIYGARESDRVTDTRTMARLALDKKAKPQDRAFEDEDSVTEAQPYYAILHADGDKMGALIETKNSPKEHRDFSRKLSEFALGVQQIVEAEPHHGYKIYSGGDDVLALLPVDTAIACARALAKDFADKLKDFATDEIKPSLSVGIAIVHYREPLSISLDYARAAEKAAKNKGDKNPENHGNRLAVALHTRGGAPSTVVEPWKKDGVKLELEKLLELYQGQESVSRGVPYELRELVRQWLPELPAKALQAEVLRIIKRKQATKEADKQSENTNWFDLPVSDAADSKVALKALETFANKLVLARFLSGIGGENAK